MLSKPNILTAVDQNVENQLTTTVIGEWTMSRYTTIVDGFPQTNETQAQKDEGEELGYMDLFPRDSVVRQFRDPGIIYSTLYNSYSASYASSLDVLSEDRNNTVRTTRVTNWEWPESKRTDNRLYPRTYVAGRDVSFKYWISSAKTLAATDVNGRTAGQFSCTSLNSSRALSLSIEFDDALTVNKLVAKMNTHIGNPQGVEFWVKESGTWNQVASGLNVGNSGVLEVYRPLGGGTWTTTPAYYTTSSNNTTTITGIRIKVNSMLRTLPSGATENAKNASFELVEFTPRLAVDLSDRVEGISVSNELGNNDLGEQLIGNVSSSTGSITLSNDDGFLDSFGANTILRDKLSEFVEFTADVTYQNISGTATQRTARLLSMVTDPWTSSGEDTVTANLVDYSKVLQHAEAQEILVSDIPAYAAIWLLCDGVGFNRVDIFKADNQREDDLKIEYFWTDGKKTVWEYIQEIAKSYQLAVFFDYAGRLQVYTRKYLWDRDYADKTGAAMDYTIRGETSGANLATMIDSEKTEIPLVNKVSVTYSALNLFNYAKSRNSIVWRAPDPLVLGAADIVQSANQGDTQLKIDPRYDDALFKFNGRFSIEDRDAIIEYVAKKYQLLNNTTKWIYNTTEMSRAIEANNGVRPTFTGWIKLSSPLRAAINSVVYDLRQNWKCFKYDFGATNGQNNWTPVKFVKYDKAGDRGGALSFTTSLSGGGRFKMWKDAATYDKYDRVGIKYKVVSGEDPTVGVVIFPQAGNNFGGGYHVMVLPENSSGDGDKVRVLRVKADGGEQRLPWDSGDTVYKDGVIGIGSKKGNWEILEAIIFGESGDWKISVFINGNYVATWNDSTAGSLSRTAKAQFMVGGSGRVLIDKFYIANTTGKKADRDLTFHRIGRKDLLYNHKLSPSDKQFNHYKSEYLKKRYNARFWSYEFNSAGWATAREVAHFKADFEKPAIKQDIYLSNKSAKVTRYKKGPISASFTLENTTERNQLLQGSKETRVSGAQKDQATFIFAKTFQIQDPQTIEYKDQDLITTMGENAIELEGVWLQSAEAANDVAKYLRDRMGKRLKRYSVSLYGNPLLEPGDLVAVYWPNHTIANDTYVVSSVSHSWNDGLETTVQLLEREDPLPKNKAVVVYNIDDDAMTPPEFVKIDATAV